MSLKWLDELLDSGGPKPEPEDEDISLEKITDMGITPSSDKGAVWDKNGKLVANVDSEIRAGQEDYEMAYKLRVPVDAWERTTVVCDGNAVEIATELAPNGRYIVKRTLRGFKPTMVVEESEIKLRDFETIREFMEWIATQDDDVIEAMRQIYYDQWCFDTGSRKDKMYYELLEEEKKIRA